MHTVCLQQCGLTCCVSINRDLLVIDNWHHGVMLDEVRQEIIRIWANLIYICPHAEKQVVFGTLHRTAVTYLENE